MEIQLHGLRPHCSCFSTSLGMRVQPPESPNVIEVFGSLPATFNRTLTRQVAAMIQCSSPHFTLRYIDVQHQHGGDDCALFAVAFAEALCAGKDPHVLSFDQQQMRQHLQLCFEQGAITSFPAATKSRRLHHTRVKAAKIIHVYCTCRLPWDRKCCQELGS